MMSRRAWQVLLVLAVGLAVPALAIWYTSRPRADDGPGQPGAGDKTAELRLLWLRHDAPLETTWPDQPRFTSDGAVRPVPAGDLVLLTSSRHDSVTAVSAADGQVRWRFVADGPVRFAPAVWNGRVYAASDDGHLYCLDRASGELKWKFRGAPTGRLVLGNERLISTWPARGAPVVVEEKGGGATVYFAAGIWPFMGIFLYALDAETKQVRWANTGDGSTFRLQPHGGAYAFAGVAPQGNLVVAGDKLLVPGGRSIPACYDRHTGRLDHYRLADVSRLGGGPDVVLGPEMYLNGGSAFSLAKGDYLGPVGEASAIAGRLLVTASGTTVRVFDLALRPEALAPRGGGRRGGTVSDSWLGDPLAEVKAPVKPTALLIAGDRIWGAGQDTVFAVDLRAAGLQSRAVPSRVAWPDLSLEIDAPALQVGWQAKLEGDAAHLAFADDRLLVSTRQGRLHAFSEKADKAAVHPREATPLPAASEEMANYAKKALAEVKSPSGYAVVWGVGSGGLIAEMLKHPAWRLIVVEPDAAKAASFREKLRLADLDGKRVSVLAGTAQSVELPPYLASLVVCEPGASSGLGLDAGTFESLFATLRPYGGVACLPIPDNRRGTVRDWAKSRRGDDKPTLADAGELALIRRAGALPGAGNWTHQHADATNSRVSPDSRVKAPLGLLWFGGPGNQDILPRHGHGPVPQVVDGRLVIEGADGLRAIDVYTGRLLWEAKFPGLGKAYDNTAHQPGANAIGSNYVSTPEGIYVAYRDRCVRLDPDTGKEAQRFQLPALEGEKGAPEWTFLTVAGGYLIGGASPRGTLDRVLQRGPTVEKGQKRPARDVLRGSESSRVLTVMDRQTGKPLWSATARDGFRHNAICVGGGKLFAMDREPFRLRDLGKGRAQDKDKSKDEPTDDPRRARLTAFDLASGEPKWQAEKGAFGTWLSYSERHDVVVEAGLVVRDSLAQAADEPRGMRAYKGSTGDVLWYKEKYAGPAILHGDRVLKSDDMWTTGTACDLKTGKPIRTKDPLTGLPIEWKWKRFYGCNTPAASENLVVFRSGSAGVYDLCNDGGTANLGGFRSSCTMNLIPAGGVLTVPDFTRTCTCAYQNQASVGLIHMPDAELWTFSTARELDGPVRRAGVNLAGPGSRVSPAGTLWLEHPNAMSGVLKRLESPQVVVTTTPKAPATFRKHPTQVAGDGPSWVTSSGMTGLTKLTVQLGEKGGQPRAYQVKLYFLEPDGHAAGTRVFDVAVQGKTVLTDLDVSQEAGGPDRGLVKTVKGVRAGGELVLTLTAKRGTPVLSGVEVIAEGW